MHHAVDFALRKGECIAVHGFLANRPVRRMIRLAPHDIQHDGPLAEVDAFVADWPAPTPTFVATKRAAHQPSGGIGNRHVAPPPAPLEGDKKVRSVRTTDFPE